MAIVRSLEGTFYDIPDVELGQYQVPADQVKKLMESAGGNPGSGPQQHGNHQGQGKGQTPQGAPQILVQFITAGAPAVQQQAQKPAEGQD